MFSDLVESSLFKNQTHRGWTVVVSGIVQIVSLGILILIPLIYMQALPTALSNAVLVTPLSQSAHAPLPDRTHSVRTPHHTADYAWTVPVFADKRRLLENETAPPEPVPDFLSNESVSIIPGIGAIETRSATHAVVPPSVPKAEPPRIKRGGNIQQGLLISQIKPIYPPIAIPVRIQGTVVLHAIIDAEGRVAELQLISGPPLLVNAAMDAVRQWRYKPTTLNGDPVEVETTITVTFTLGN